MEHAVIEAKDLIKNYNVNPEDNNPETLIKVLRGLNFAVQKGEYVSIMGRSGCGKSTLLKILGMMERPDQGTVYLDGMDTKELWSDELADLRRRRIGFVFQEFMLMESLTIADNIVLPLILDKAGEKKMRERLQNLAQYFGIEHLLKKRPRALSGGEKQRAAVCRALVNSPDILLADEPSGNLDSVNGHILLDMLDKVHQEMGGTLIVVTHDAEVASRSQKTFFMKDGVITRILERGSMAPESFQKEILLCAEKVL